MNTLSRAIILSTLAALAGTTQAQSLISSGLLHTPLGNSVITETTERRVRALGIGSSGQDGVEVTLHSRQGGEVEIDMGPLVTPDAAGGEIKIKHKGWDGLIYHRHSRVGGAGGGSGGSVTIEDEVDFSSMGNVRIHVTATLSDGSTRDLTNDASIFRFTSIYQDDPTSPPSVRMGAGKVSFSDLSFMSTMRNSRPATILVASSTGSVEFIPEVVAMSFRPICIVAPCPGDWTNLLSMEVTSTLPEIECSNAALDWSWGTSNPTTAGGGGLGAGRVLLHGTGDGQLEELHNTDLDGDGAPDLAVRCTEVNSLPGTRGVVTTFSSPPTDHFSFRHTRTGHVTLMKFTDDEGEELRISTVTDPLSGETLLTPDFSSLGSTECDVVGLDPSGGEVFRTPWTSLQPPYALRSSTCPGEVVPTYGCDRNTLTFEGCDGGTLTIANPTIGIISGIARLRFEPISPATPFGSLSSLSVESCCEDIIVGDYRFVGPAGPVCDSLDFNNDGSFFDPQDIDAFLSVFSEGPCLPDTATCNDIDFNNDTSLFDPCDINAFLTVYAEGPCTSCGE
jgi:hypothetical protein